jgi:hypothetical protein
VAEVGCTAIAGAFFLLEATLVREAEPEIGSVETKTAYRRKTARGRQDHAAHENRGLRCCLAGAGVVCPVRRHRHRARRACRRATHHEIDPSLAMAHILVELQRWCR